MRKLPRNAFPLIVEATPGNKSLDTKRREHVIKLLAKNSAKVPAERVRVGASPARGMDGIDALSIDESSQGTSGSDVGTSSSDSGVGSQGSK